MTRLRLIACLAALAACGEANPPLNAPLRAGENLAFTAEPGGDEAVWVGLAFSGGGHRATAFAYGVLTELDEAGLAGEVGYVSGVSGGAVLAAWFALQGPDGLPSFRGRYLLADGERYMLPNGFDAAEVAGALGQGLNARDTFGRALEESLFRGARFADLAGGPVSLQIVASDVASAAPFVFGPDTFDALCSDLSRLPLSEAVAASAAFPVVFSPYVIEAHRRDCAYAEPPALNAARADPGAQPALRLYAETQALYADPAEVQSVRLLDGGMTDRYGTTGFLAARARGGTPWAPMTEAEALRANRILFLAVDAEQEHGRVLDLLGPSGRLLGLTLYGLSQRLGADGGGELDLLQSQRAITSTTRGSFATLGQALVLWRRDIVAWRCALTPEELDGRWPDRPEGWNCRDLHVHLAEVDRGRLPEAVRDAVDEVPTRLRLPQGTVDLVTAAGRLALRNTGAYGAFLQAVAD